MLTMNEVQVGYDEVDVLSGISLHLDKGEIGCLIGPSGCGKTSLLRAIAGFNPILNGIISINGQTVSSKKKSLPVDKRHIGIIFQDFALFPHLTVFQNIAYGLFNHEKNMQNLVVNKMLVLVGLQDLKNKYPSQLSGGQQQRVAIARALAPNPSLLLLDEPFSNLDPSLRVQLVEEIRDIIKQQNITALMVTHDQQEAFAMADKIAVLHAGKCQQWGRAYELYHTPATESVASFIGEGTFIHGELMADCSIKTALGAFTPDNAQQWLEGQHVKLLIRPDDIIHDDKSVFKATVSKRVFRGAYILYSLSLQQSNEKVLCLAPSHHDHRVGESFGIRLNLDHVICFAAT